MDSSVQNLFINPPITLRAGETKLETTPMNLEQFHILYSSDGTYTIIENDGSKRYEFSYKHKNLTYDEVLKCVEALKSGYNPTAKLAKNQPQQIANSEKDKKMDFWVLFFKNKSP